MSPGYIVTGWEIRVSASPFFLDFITAISKHYGFKTILCPVYLPDLEYLPSSLKERFDIILTTNLKLNQNLEIVLASTHALVKHPLQGWRGAFDHTVIIPALIKSLETEPSQKLSKQLITTGSVGFMTAKPSDYAEFGEKTVEKLSKRWATTQRQGRILAQAQHYVKPSALIVEILSRHRFVTRYVTMDNKRQKFLYDLNLKFDGKRFLPHTPDALVMGDLHQINKDKKAFSATIDQIKCLKPKQVVLNDYTDLASINHHIIRQPSKYDFNISLEEERESDCKTLKFLSRLCKKLIYLQSNHDNFLIKILSMTNAEWRFNRNYKTLIELEHCQLTQKKHPIVYYLRMSSFKNLKFIPETEQYRINKVLVKHGHEGIGGKPASFRQLALLYNYYVQGHTHSPKVYRNAVNVGTNSRLDLDYVVGASGWLHANAIIHPDSTIQLLPIINGQWRRMS